MFERVEKIMNTARDKAAILMEKQLRKELGKLNLKRRTIHFQDAMGVTSIFITSRDGKFTFDLGGDPVAWKNGPGLTYVCIPSWTKQLTVAQRCYEIARAYDDIAEREFAVEFKMEV